MLERGRSEAARSPCAVAIRVGELPADFARIAWSHEKSRGGSQCALRPRNRAKATAFGTSEERSTRSAVVW